MGNDPRLPKLAFLLVASASVFAPGGAMAVTQPAGATTAPTKPASVEFDVPPSWSRQDPSSNMRLAQGTISGPGGPGEFAVFFFGSGSGGSVDANIERWAAQMESSDPPKTQTFEAHGLKVTWVEIKGTLKSNQMGPRPTAPPLSNARLYAAVVEGPGGPWFFKATGPDATLAPQRDAFVTMLKSVRPRP
jgi:hypothetical protein